MNEIIAMILSLVGMCFNVLSFQVRKKITLLLVQTAGSLVFSISYIFADGGFGAVLNITFLARNILLMIVGDRKGAPMIASVVGLCVAYITGYCIYSFVFNADAPTSDFIWNAVILLGAFIGTIGMSFSNLNLFRAIKLGDSACWLAFNSNIGLGALGGILTEIFSICSIFIALFRFRKKKDEPRQALQEEAGNEIVPEEKSVTNFKEV